MAKDVFDRYLSEIDEADLGHLKTKGAGVRFWVDF